MVEWYAQVVRYFLEILRAIGAACTASLVRVFEIGMMARHVCTIWYGFSGWELGAYEGI